LKISGKVIWCILTKSIDTVKGEYMPVYHAGFEFPEVFNEKACDLIGFMKKNVIVQLEERLFGRFKFNPKEPVNLNCEYDFLVKTMSRSGMLIETEILADRNSIFVMELAMGGRKINFTGRVAHVKQIDGEGNRKIAHLGIQFVDLSVEARETLEQYIKDEIES
ncbi:MAG: PilZ domain-containing protein, partial [bacterium]